MSDPTPAVEASTDDPPFSVSASTAGTGIITVGARGEIDLLTAPRVGTALEAAQDQAAAVLLDLREVGFLGSAGLSVLVDATRRAADRQGRFAVLVTAHAVARAIEITGLDSALAVFDDDATALEYLTS